MSKKNAKAKIQKLTLSSSDVQLLHCPFCGRVVESHDSGLAEQLCEHVLFAWTSLGDFVHVSHAFTRAFPKHQEHHSAVNRLKQLETSNAVVLVERYDEGPFESPIIYFAFVSGDGG